MDASSLLRLLAASFARNPAHAAVEAAPASVAGIFGGADAADLAALARPLAQLLVTSESHGPVQHGSSTSWLVAALRGAGCAAFAALGPAELLDILGASAEHNGEYTSELMVSLHTAGCGAHQWLALAPSDVVAMLERHASATCRDADRPQLMRLLQRLDQAQLLVPEQQRDHMQQRRFQGLVRGYPTGSKTTLVIEALQQVGWNRWAECSSAQLFDVLQRHASRAAPWTGGVVNALRAAGASLGLLTAAQVQSVLQRVDESYRDGVRQALLTAGAPAAVQP